MLFYTKEIISMGKKKYYAVKKGLEPGIYDTWDKCLGNVNGYPGAEYRSFDTKEEAEKYLFNLLNDSLDDNISRVYTNSDAIAYVDGCFNDTTNEYSYGLVIFYNGIEEHYSAKFADDKMVTMRNVAGEIEGAKKAMEICLNSNIKSLDIVYDYIGIENWCTGAWKANKPGSREYKDFYNKIKDALKVAFIKVKSHTGNKYNELADQIAKNAVGLGQASSVAVHDNGIVANGIKLEDLESIFELMKEEFSDLNFAKREIAYGYNYTLIINKPNKQQLSINYFTDKNKVCILGRKEDLFNKLSLYIVELLETDEIPKFLNTVHNLSVDVDIIDVEFERLFPNSYNKLPKEVNNYLHQAVYNLHIIGNNMYTTNFLVEPAVRPLEAFLKIILQENSLPIRQEDKEVDTFFIFKEKDDNYFLKEQYVTDDLTKEFIKYVSVCYTYYNKNRNTLFHWDNPKDEVDTTRVLHTVEEAHTIIRDIISLIDSYYKK